MDISFPNRVWDGQSGAREDTLTNRPPDNLDWNRIIAELAATQRYLLALQDVVNNLSGGGGSAPGGSSGQVQINASGSLAGLRGNALVEDPNDFLDAVAIGLNSYALGEQSIVVGYNCKSTTDQSVAFGNNCVAGDPLRACVINDLTITISGGDYTGWFYGSDGGLVLSNLSGGSGPTIAYGSINDDLEDGGISYDGSDTILTLKESVTSHTSGYVNMRDDGTSCFAWGIGSTSRGLATCAEGHNTLAESLYSHAEGNGTSASGSYSHAEGLFTNAANNAGASHTEGDTTTTHGFAAHAEGSMTVASGFYSHVEGNSAIASGESAHAEGDHTTASGKASYAGGLGATASHLCEWARSDNSSIGKIGHLIISGTTSDTNPTSLLISGSDLLTLASNSNLTFFIILSATKSDGSVTASFIRYGQIKNVDGTLTLSSIQTIGTDINANSWIIDITADTEDGALQISVTAEDTVNWQGRIEFVEVRF